VLSCLKKINILEYRDRVTALKNIITDDALHI